MSTAATASRRAAPQERRPGVRAWVRVHRRAIEISALTLTAALAGFLFLSRESLWLDEAFSVKLAGSGWGTIWDQLSYKEANGSPYYLLLHFWLGLGKGEFAVRGLSVVAAVAAIPIFYLTAARLFSARAALFGSLLLVTNAFFVYYEQEARSYALALLLVVLATYALIRWLDEPSVLWTAVYVGAASLSIYAHLFSLYVIAAHAASLLARRRTLPRLSWTVGMYALVAILLVPLMLYFATGYTGQLWWVRSPTLHDLHTAFLSLTGGAGSPAHPHSGRRFLLLGYAAACLLGLVAAAWRWRVDRNSSVAWPYALVLAWLSFPTLGGFVVSFWKPMFVDRYLIVALPPLAMLAGAGLAEIRLRGIRLAALGALVGLSLAQVVLQYGDQTKEDWRAAAAYVSASAKPGDAVVVYSPYMRMPFEYYFDRSPSIAAQVTPLYPASPWGKFDLAVDQGRQPNFAALARSQDRYRRVWLVLSQNELNQYGIDATNRLSRLLGRGRTASVASFRGPISVTLESRSAPARRSVRPDA
jgi:mannosyltransferase